MNRPWHALAACSVGALAVVSAASATPPPRDAADAAPATKRIERPLARWRVAHSDGVAYEMTEVDPSTELRITKALYRDLEGREALTVFQLTERVPPTAQAPHARDPGREVVILRQSDGQSFGSLGLKACRPQQAEAVQALLPPGVAACQDVVSVAPGEALTCALLFRGQVDPARITRVEILLDGKPVELLRVGDAAEPVRK